MSFTINNINEYTIKAFVDSLRPVDPVIRKQLDFGYSYDDNVVMLYEIRPVWNNPKENQNIPYAKIRYYKSRSEWNLYWMRGNGNWEIYKPFPKSSNLQKMLELIKEDKNYCFFG